MQYYCYCQFYNYFWRRNPQVDFNEWVFKMILIKHIIFDL